MTGGGLAPHVDELPELAYAEEVRVGSVDDPDAGFSAIRALRVSDAGAVYVLESAAREVRVFSPDGERVLAVGGPGQGPGEFSSPSGLGLLGDTLWVVEGISGRITWFGPSGDVLFTTPGQTIPIESSVPGLTLSVRPMSPQPNGLIESGLTRRYTADDVVRSRAFSYPVVRFDRSGAVVDTARWETFEPGPTYRVGGREFFAPALAPRRPVERGADDGRFVLDWSVPTGHSDGLLEVVRLAAGGDTLYHRELRYPPRPAPAAELLDSLITPGLGIASLLGVGEGEMERALRSTVELPDFRPPLRSTHLGRDGTLWIELNTASTEHADWILLGGDGSPRGRLTLPLRTRIHHSDGPTVWAVELDELEVPWLVRLRVE